MAILYSSLDATENTRVRYHPSRATQLLWELVDGTKADRLLSI
jgi:hypothetical protein